MIASVDYTSAKLRKRNKKFLEPNILIYGCITTVTHTHTHKHTHTQSHTHTHTHTHSLSSMHIFTFPLTPTLNSHVQEYYKVVRV